MLGVFKNQIHLSQGDALLVVDLQNDFLPGGALPVANGDQVIPIANRYIQMFLSRKLPIIASRDWHPKDHCSFATQGGPWPSHCIQDTPGAEFAAGFDLPETSVVVSKGDVSKKEAYSAFAGTDLATVVRQRQIKRLLVCGIATEYCVLETVKSALSEGLDVLLLSDGIKAVRDDDGRLAVRKMLESGANVYQPPKPKSPAIDSSALLTDFYQLTMLQAYFQHGVDQEAVFEFFVRKLPDDRNFLLAAGLEQVLEFLEGFCFTKSELDWLYARREFRKDFVDYLGDLRFSGDVHAMPEGTIFFANQPILRVTAPLPQAQLVESRLINLLHFQTLIASKAIRCRLAAPDKLLVDFGMRRAHGAEAAVYASRASFIAGFDGTATVLGGMINDIPVYGTMAHSFVQAHDDESEAFANFASANPDNVVLLIDTYDTEAAAEKTVQIARRLRENGIEVKGVRLDSGDLNEHAKRVRKILDQGGLLDTTIFASGNLDEYELHKLYFSHSPIDGFGVGTRVDVSSDSPYLDCAYKLQEYAGKPRRKRSEGKATWPGRKQVYRQFKNGLINGDILTLDNDPAPGKPLLELMMQGGQRLEPRTPAHELRRRVTANLTELPKQLLSLHTVDRYPVEISQALQQLTSKIDRDLATSKSLPR